MDRVVLYRRGAFLPLDRPLQVAGYGLAWAGTIMIGYLFQGWPAVVLMGVMAIAGVAMSVHPIKILTADRDGVSIPNGRRRERLGWEQVSLLAVFSQHGGAVTVGVRSRPDGTPPARPWTQIAESLQHRLQPTTRLRRQRPGKPFTLIFETRCTARSATEPADRLQQVASVPVARPGADPAEPYRVRARRRSVLPVAAFFLAWNGVLGTIWATALTREYPHALFPAALIGVGAGLVLADLLIPLMTLTADATGLRFDGQFLAWTEITAITLTHTPGGTDLLVRTIGPAAAIAPQVRRRLPGVRIDPARLAAAAPHVAVELVAPR